MGGSPYSDNSQSSYDNNMPQQSPDPQGLANMNIASPIGIQSPDPTIESILGTEHGGGAAAAAKIRWQEIGQGSGTGVGLQRGSKADGAAAVEPLHTPNISNTLSTGDVKFTSGDLRDLSAVLKNCPE